MHTTMENQNENETNNVKKILGAAKTSLFCYFKVVLFNE